MKKIYWIPLLVSISSVILIILNVVSNNIEIGEVFSNWVNYVILIGIALYNLYFSVPKFQKWWFKLINKEIVNDLEFLVRYNDVYDQFTNINDLTNKLIIDLKQVIISDKIRKYGLVQENDKVIRFRFKKNKIEYGFKLSLEDGHFVLKADKIHGRIKSIYSKLNDIKCIVNKVNEILIKNELNTDKKFYGTKMYFEDEKHNPYIKHVFSISNPEISHIDHMKIKIGKTEITESNITVNSATMEDLIDEIKTVLA